MARLGRRPALTDRLIDQFEPQLERHAQQCLGGRHTKLLLEHWLAQVLDPDRVAGRRELSGEHVDGR